MMGRQRHRLRSIGAQLSGGFLVVAGLALVMGVVGYLQVNAVKDLLVSQAVIRSEARYKSTQMRVETTAASELVREYLLHVHNDEKARIRELLNQRLRTLTELLSQEERLAQLPGEQTQLAEIRRLFTGFQAQTLLVLQEYDAAGYYNEKTSQAVRSFEVGRAQLIEALIQLEDTEAELLRASQNAARDAAQMALVTISALSIVTLMAALGMAVVFSLGLVRRLARLQAGAAAIGAGDLDHAIELRSGDELEDLAAAFNVMAGNLRASRAEIVEYTRTLEQRVAERTQALAELVDTQQRLLEMIRETSAPVVPILPGVIVLPLVGVVDSQRAGRIVDALLAGITTHRAQVALIDVTGVPVVDTSVAQLLLQAAAAARLLGAQTVLVGIRPEVAQTVVGLGIDLSAIVARADLQSGVEYAQRITAPGGRGRGGVHGA